MNRVVITTDSGIDPINEDMMISGQIIKNNKETFRDIKEITPREIIEQSKQGDVFTTSSPILGDYFDKFQEQLENENDVIHLCMSSGISEGSVNTPNIAANELNSEYDNKIYVVDTLNATTGGTLINEYAKMLVKQKLSTKEIVDKLNTFKEYIQTSFYVPYPAGFIRSGRNKGDQCLKDKALSLGGKITQMTGIRLRVDFNSRGNLYPKSMMRCNVPVGMTKFIKSIVNDKTIESYQPDYAVVGNVLEKDVQMEEIVRYLEQFKYFKNIINQSINGVVACYGSEDLCGISLIKKP